MSTATLAGEMKLAAAIRNHLNRAFEGDTDTASRRESFRKLIRDNQLESVIAVTGKNGKPLTYSEAFEGLYREPL